VFTTKQLKNVKQNILYVTNSFQIKTYPKKLTLILKNTIKHQTLTYGSETLTLTTRERNQWNIFERKLYRRILGPVYGNEKENFTILTFRNRASYI
jgi:hypothetical protein